MDERVDIVIDRSERGLCPICAKPITEDFQTLMYDGRKVWVCKNHKVYVGEMKRWTGKLIGT